MLTVDEIRSYWEDRAAGDSSAQSTTQDYFMREIELRALIKCIEDLKPKKIADIGCGDGRTTIGIAKKMPDIKFTGLDYSGAMVENSRVNQTSKNITNIIFDQHDIRNPLNSTFDVVYTTRCLINLPDWELQQSALRNIHGSLNDGGHYLMIENFVEGQENFNRLRHQFDLAEIPVRNHNLFFQRNKLLDDIEDLFAVKDEINISSTYYIVSRIVYSRICADKDVQPDYFDEHHRYGANLPFLGEYGPVRLLILQKK